jgi:hypothetical protein
VLRSSQALIALFRLFHFRWARKWQKHEHFAKTLMEGWVDYCTKYALYCISTFPHDTTSESLSQAEPWPLFPQAAHYSNSTSMTSLSRAFASISIVRLAQPDELITFIPESVSQRHRNNILRPNTSLASSLSRISWASYRENIPFDGYEGYK